MTCAHCGGSGILNVESSDDCIRWEPAASPCHACPAGRLWVEVGL